MDQELRDVLATNQNIACSVPCSDGSMLAVVVRDTHESVLLMLKRDVGLLVTLAVPIVSDLVLRVDGSGSVPVIEVADHMIRGISW
jgi:hypothetical protein